MKKDYKKLLLRNMLEQVWENAAQAPGRSVRNLVDMGIQCSRGRFQINFLKYAQKMLENRSSAYYELMADLLTNVKKDNLLTFGMNVGYNGCMVGAKRIRSIEEKEKIQVPWSLSMILDEERLTKGTKEYEEIIRQGLQLGVYVYPLFLWGGMPEKVLPLLQTYPECVFVLFLRECDLSQGFPEKVSACKNTLVSVYADENAEETCRHLREQGILYGVYKKYRTADELMEEGWLMEQSRYLPYFIFVCTEDIQDQKVLDKIYERILKIRFEQKYRAFVFDVKSDIRKIDSILSGEPCVIGVRKDGSLTGHARTKHGEPLNIFQNSLSEILHKI